MKVTKFITVDLSTRGCTNRIDAVQGETAREVGISLYSNGSPWDIPEGTAVLMRFRKPDGTGGTYDSLPDETRAYQILGNKVSITLAPQALTVEGVVSIQVAFLKDTDIVATFPMLLNVYPDPALGTVQSEDYTSIGEWILPEAVTAAENAMNAAEEAKAAAIAASDANKGAITAATVARQYEMAARTGLSRVEYASKRAEYAAQRALYPIFTVNVTDNGDGTYEVDRTINDIQSAEESKQSAWCTLHLNEQVHLPMTLVYDGVCYFTTTCGNTEWSVSLREDDHMHTVATVHQRELDPKAAAFIINVCPDQNGDGYTIDKLYTDIFQAYGSRPIYCALETKSQKQLLLSLVSTEVGGAFFFATFCDGFMWMVQITHSGSGNASAMESHWEVGYKVVYLNRVSHIELTQAADGTYGSSKTAADIILEHQGGQDLRCIVPVEGSPVTLPLVSVKDDDGCLTYLFGGSSAWLCGNDNVCNVSASLLINRDDLTVDVQISENEVINTEQINSHIDSKADDFYVDPETNMLYLTSNGQPIGSGVQISLGSGGGGGGSLTYAITLNNMLPSRVITVSEGTKVELVFSYASVDDAGIDDGPGVGKIIVGAATKLTFSAVQGGNIQDVTPYLSAGANTVKVQVENSEGVKKTLTYTITIAAAHLTSAFDTSAPFTGNIQFPYTPVGFAEKTMHFEVDGAEIGTTTVTTSGRQQNYTIPALSHGAHTLRAWFDCQIEGAYVASNILTFQLLCTEPGNTSKIISVDFSQLGNVEQFSSIVTRYRVYDPLSLIAYVTLEANGEVVSNQTVDRTEQVWTYRPTEVGELLQTIRCGDTSAHWSRTVTETSIPVKAETEALALLLSSYGRSNNEETRDMWKSGNISCDFRNFNFVSDGWQIDDNGETVCRITGDARLHVPYKMFAYDFRTTGKTIEFELATKEVLDYDAEVINCFAGERGFIINAQQLRLASEQSFLGARYKEDEHIRVTFVVQKKSSERLILCYINGILSRSAQYPSDDDFSQPEPVDITIGSNNCTVDLYTIRVYDNDLSSQQALDNWIADTRDPKERLARFLRNQIYDVYGNIVISKLPNDLCYMVLECSELPQYKGDKKTCSGYFVDRVNPGRSFSFKDIEIDVQGTSSQYYWVKNYKNKFKTGFIMSDGSTAEAYAINANAIPVSTFTMKADVASSEGYYNVVTAQLFNQYHPLREEGSKARYSIDGFPIVIFWDNGSETKFLGKYNFNNDKGTPEPFGLSEGDERWEVLQNGTARVGFHSADFSDDSWKEDFEGNYPDKNTDLTNLQPMCEWVASTDTEQATGNPIDPITYNGVEYTTDTAEYRLAKFDAELGDHFHEAVSAYYYVFTEAFLCMDQREKNVLWRFVKALMRWLIDYYDADSIIGHNNQAQPVFDYWMEDIDYTVSGDPVYNGQNSVFWKNLRATRYEDLKAAWHELRGKGFSYETVMAAFAAHKSRWPEAIYNEDMKRKCLDPLIEDGDGTYLPFLLGDKWSWTQQFLYKRFRYLDSKYEYGASLENRATIRTNVMVNLTLTYYMKLYGHTYYNAEHVVNRVEKGVPCEFVSHATGAEDRVIGLNDSDFITSLGDLSGHQVELIDLSKMIRLLEIKLGDGAEGYVNNSLNTVTFGNNKMLRKADLRNCAALTQAVDMSGCTNIEEIYFDGSSITGLKLPNGGILKNLHLPDTVTNLTLRNQTKLEDFHMPSYSQITTLWLENNSSAVDVFEILSAIPANSRVRLIGINQSVDTYADFEDVMTTLNSMRGLDENGNNVDTAQVSGTVHIGSLTSKELYEITSRYPSITVTYDTLVTYTVRFYNGDTLLQTVEGVKYMDTVEYPGEEPTKEGDFSFNGWSPEPVGVTGDMDCYAQFKFNGSYARALVQRTIEGDYENARVTSVGDYAFRGCDKLTAVNMDKATNVGEYAFNRCSDLTRVSMAEVTEIGGYAFYESSHIANIDFPKVSTVGDWAFASDDLKELVLPETITTLGEGAFGFCYLSKIVIPSSLTSLGGRAWERSLVKTAGPIGSGCDVEFGWVEEFPDNSFCGMPLESITLPKGLKKIGSNSFYSSRFSEFVIPETVTTLDDMAFSTTSIVELYIPDTVTSISSYRVTYSSPYLKKVRLPVSATHFDSWFFWNCAVLETIILPSTILATLNEDNAFDNTPVASGTGYIYVPRALIEDYKVATNWSTYADQFRAIEDYPEICGGEV